ncbi:MAG: glycoside hydrolase family 13 protein [Roseburia sp.]
MNMGLFSHRAALNECYALDEKRLVITLRTGYDVERVFLNYGDPFSAGIMGGAEKWSGEQIEMTECKNLEYHKLWTVVIEPKYRRCKYYFEITSGEETVYYFEDGCYTKERMEMPGRKEQCFFFPWMNPSDIAKTPDWVADTIWYQIFPDRFCNGNSAINPSYVKPWKCEKTGYWDVYGGDLEGIRKKIPYLKDLGITGIYLTPIFQANSNHKYNTMDYRKIDENFGDEETLKKLVKELHEAGIRVMLDAVFNHSGKEFAPWQDVLEKGKESKYFDWFFIQEWPIDRTAHHTRDGKFFSFAFAADMPKLNTNHPEVIAYFKDICSYWLKEWKIDGIRFDVGNEVSHTFLKEIRSALKAINPEVYLLGEIWHDSISWLQGDEYDSVMNYPFCQSLNEFYIDPGRTAKDFECSINRCYSLYMEQTNRVLFNLLDSHDTERLKNRVKNMGQFYQQLAILFTMEGSPCIYYGTEIAMEGAHDPDCRRCMPWEKIEQGEYQEEIAQMKALIAVRKNYAACKSGKLQWIKEEGRTIHYQKKMEGQPSIGVYLNASDKEVNLPEKGKLLFSFGCVENVVKPDGVCIYVV